MDLFAMLMHASEHLDGQHASGCADCAEVVAFAQDNAGTRDVIRRQREFSLEPVRCYRCRRKTHTIVFLSGLMFGPRCAALVQGSGSA